MNSHSATNSQDLFLGWVNSPQAVTFVKGDKKGSHFFWALARSFAALSHLTQAMRADYLLWNCISLIQFWRGLFLRTKSHIALYPLPFTTTEPSAVLEHNLPRNSHNWEPPLSLRTQLLYECGRETIQDFGWVGWSMHHYRHRMSYCDGLLEVSWISFWETLEATKLFLFQTYWHHRCKEKTKTKNAHTVNEPTAYPNALRNLPKPRRKLINMNMDQR